MIGEVVLDLLRAEHYAVDWVKDCEMADTALMQSQAYDLVLLDLGLPRKDGLEVLRAMRTRKDRTPVLVATARDSVGQRIAGLDAGADDYVLKPYDLDELLARIRALLRRSSGRAEPVLRANGKHRAVAVPGGRHRVEMRYHPPGLALGMALTAIAAAAAAAAWIRPVLRAEPRV